jgi:hypothetical protein
VGAGELTSGEERFFADCPRRRPLSLHDARHPWDLHALAYTAVGISELELLRMADWVVDLPLPGEPVRPFERTTTAIRAGYHWLPRWRLIMRAGEFVDAWQVPELSLGDASATYSVAMGGTAGPGSGMLVRFDKLVDWAQHVTGDVNQAAGAVVGRPQGLVQWVLPERAIDATQWLLLKTFAQVRVLLGRTVDSTLEIVEVVGEGIVNLGYRPPHQERAVFLQVPRAVAWAQQLWLREHRSHLVIGTAEEFARSTHATLAHHRRSAATIAEDRWDPADAPEVVVMMDRLVFSRAPEALRAYVVPAAWVLNPAIGPRPLAVGPSGALQRAGGRDVAPRGAWWLVPRALPVGLHETDDAGSPDDARRGR